MTYLTRYMLVREEDMESDVLSDEIVVEAITEISDAVHGRRQVSTRRVYSQTYWCHPSARKMYC